MTVNRLVRIAALSLASLTGPALAVEVLGASTNTARGNDLLGMAAVCHAQFGNGARVCQSEDAMRATAIGTLPDNGIGGQAVVLYLQPSIKGGAALGGTGASSIDALGAANIAFTSPQCIKMERVLTMQAEPINTFELTAACGELRQIVCCRD